MKDSFVIAIDGGGTKTLSALWGENGEFIAGAKEGPSNPLFVGEEKAGDAILSSVKRLLPYLPSKARGFLILGGGGRPQTPDELKALLPHWEFRSIGDHLPALRAALTKGEEGVVVRSGTGSFAIGQDKEGRTVSIDALGPLLGDEGSATDIGLMALRVVGEHFDGREYAPCLARRVMEYFNASSLWDLVSRLHKEGVKRHEIANLSRIVWECREEGPARRILYEAGRRLAKSALCAGRVLNLKAPAFYVGGGVFKAKEVFRAFKAKVRKHYPNAYMGYSPLEPLAGAFLLVMEWLGREVSEEMKRNLRKANELY